MLRELRKLLCYTGGGLHFLFLLILRSPVDFTMTAMNAVFLQHAFNAIEQDNARGLTFACLLFGIASLCVFLYNGTIWSMYAPFVVRMEKRLRIRLFDKITKFSYAHIEKTAHSEWLTRLNTDVQMPFSQPLHLPHAVNAILRISISAVILWHINQAVFGWVMLFVVLHVLQCQLLVARTMPKLNKQSLEATAINTGELTAIITCADMAALYDGQAYLMRRFEKSSLALRRTRMKICRQNALNGAFTVLPFGLSGYLILLIVSGAWIANGQLTFGDLTAAFQYRQGILIGSMMFINCMVSVKASMAGIQRINKTMCEDTEEANG